MIAIGNYSLNYDRGRNKIIIGLPQTVFTSTNTISPVEDRKVDVDEKELIQLLVQTMMIFRKESSE